VSRIEPSLKRHMLISIQDALRLCPVRQLYSPTPTHEGTRFCVGTPLTPPSFPINVNIEKNSETDQFEVEIRNFVGEKLVRRVIMRQGVDVEASKNVKDELLLTGNVRARIS
jgi:hypothetical protein